MSFVCVCVCVCVGCVYVEISCFRFVCVVGIEKCEDVCKVSVRIVCISS